MNIKAQDILIVLKWLASGWPGSFALLGKETGLSASEAHAAVQRARCAGLLRSAWKSQPLRAGGIPDPWLAPTMGRTPREAHPRHGDGIRRAPLAERFPAATDDPDLPVWPDAEGDRYGVELAYLPVGPIGRAPGCEVVRMARAGGCLRGAGRARERELAEQIVRKRLDYGAAR